MAAIAADNQDVQRRLCEALGLDPSNTKTIDIQLRPGDAVMAQVNLYVQEDQFEEICLILDKCEFVTK